MMTSTSRPASPKQTAFLRTLLAERDGHPVAEEVRSDLNAARQAGTLDSRTASKAIDRLLSVKVARTGSKAPASTTTVPAGHYAVASRTGNNDLDFWRVDRPEDGPYAGLTFVKRVIGGRPDANVGRAEARQALAAIEAAGAEAAAVLYGQTIGQCYRCNRHLTDETSRQLGIGPECRKKK